MYFVYILCDKPKGRLYTGFTNDVLRRNLEHIAGVRSRYAHDRGIFWLVHLEVYGEHKIALAREYAIKGLSRKGRIALIEQHNPGWKCYLPQLLPAADGAKVFA